MLLNLKIIATNFLAMTPATTVVEDATNELVRFAGIIVVFSLVAVGILYISSVLNPEWKQKGQSVAVTVVIGGIIIAAAPSLGSYFTQLFS